MTRVPSVSGRTVIHAIQSVSGSAGGPSVVASRLAAACAVLGHRVLFLTEDPDVSDTTLRDVGLLEIHKVSRPKLTELLFRGAARRQIAALFGRVDMVYLHGVWDPLLLATAAEARLAGVPYVVIPHGMLDPWSLAQKRWKKRLALALGVRRMLDRASAIRALNRDEAELILPLKIATPVQVIPNGVDLTEVNPAPAEAGHQVLPGLAGRPYILFLSRLHYKKGLDYLADAFAQVAPKFPEVQLVVVGTDDGGRTAFEERVGQFRLAGRVHLPGPLYGPAKWATLANSTCFCLPSRQEGFSIAILEALASRVPVVISEACHFPEVGQVGAGVVTPLTAEAVAGGLEQVLGNPAAAKAMGEAGRQMVEGHYTWAKVAALCEELDRDIHAGRVMPT
jgi:glycosyltransferase involved in cell wall biosynthesis